MLCDYSKWVALYKLGEVYFRFLGMNGFHVKGKNDRFSAAVKTSNMKISRLRLADYVKKIAPKSVLHMQHDYFSSFNQSNHWFVKLSLLMPSSNLKLSKVWEYTCVQYCFPFDSLKIWRTFGKLESIKNRLIFLKMSLWKLCTLFDLKEGVSLLMSKGD